MVVLWSVCGEKDVYLYSTNVHIDNKQKLPQGLLCFFVFFVFLRFLFFLVTFVCCFDCCLIVCVCVCSKINKSSRDDGGCHAI